MNTREKIYQKGYQAGFKASEESFRLPEEKLNWKDALLWGSFLLISGSISILGLWKFCELFQEYITFLLQ